MPKICKHKQTYHHTWTICNLNFYVQKYAKKVCRNILQNCMFMPKRNGNICKNIDSMFKNMQKYAKKICRNMYVGKDVKICKLFCKYM